MAPKNALEFKVKKATERISENMHIIANEPSLAFYRLQEHVRKALPPMVEKRVEINKLNQELQGHCYDLEYAIGAVNNMQAASSHLEHIQKLIKDSIFMKQQIAFITKNKKESVSVYKRLSAHITLDLSDIPEALRETASRVESILNTTSTAQPVPAPPPDVKKEKH
ncbi:hypothetical protein M8J77_006583 [Diaphorina citri]|nr:hypothetical protein M8J77_006583 [Diaphorina citri]